MSASKSFDVFLSYNRSDKQAVEEIAKQIRSEGLSPWLDKWHLTPGKEWQNEIELALKQCEACVVFVGPIGIGSWQSEEMRAAIDRRATDPKKSFLVIPVLLPGGSVESNRDLPTFLTATTWVEFENSLDEPETFRRLICGIRGIKPDQTDQFSHDLSCPYRGLQCFDVDDARYFFGRDKLTQKLLDSIDPNQETQKTKQLLGIIGASGSGKSSLARAGLIASLKQNKISGSDKWLLRICRPKSDPLTSLATALVHSCGGETQQVIDLRKSFVDTETALHLHADLCLYDSDDQTRMVVLVDQFEEVFTQCRDQSIRQKFIDNLLFPTTLPDSKVIVVLTMRADFYGQCGQYPKLAEALSNNQVLVSPPSTSELRELLEQPARLTGCELQSGLAQRIIEETQKQAGSLPLIQHALMELWNHRDSRVLSHKVYEETGGVVGALEKRAEETFLRLDAAQQKLCRQVFLRLVEPGDATGDTKRQAALSEVMPRNPENFKEVRSVIDSLADGAARLITLDKSDETQEQKLEVSHEALINGWQRLKGWISEDREGLRIHRRLSTAALQWHDNGRDSGYLYHGAVLLTAEEWSRKSDSELNDLEESFLSSSIAERDATIERKNRLDRHLRFMAISSIGLAACAAVFMCFVGYFAYQNHKNEKRLATAKNAKLQAESEKLEAQRVTIERDRIRAEKEAIKREALRLLDLIDVVYGVNGTDQAEVFKRLATSTLDVRIEFIEQLLSRPEKAQGYQYRLPAILTAMLTSDFDFGATIQQLAYDRSQLILAKAQPTESDRRISLTCFLLMSNLLDRSPILPDKIKKSEFESTFLAVYELASKDFDPAHKLQWAIHHFSPKIDWFSTDTNRSICKELLAALNSEEIVSQDILLGLVMYRDFLSVQERHVIVRNTIDQFRNARKEQNQIAASFDFGLSDFVDDVPKAILPQVVKQMNDYEIFDSVQALRYLSNDDFRKQKRIHLRRFKSAVKRMDSNDAFNLTEELMTKSYSAKSYFAILVDRLTPHQKGLLKESANQRIDDYLGHLSRQDKVNYKQSEIKLRTLAGMHQTLFASPPNRNFTDQFAGLFLNDKSIFILTSFGRLDPESDKLKSWLDYANAVISVCGPPSAEILQKYEKAILDSTDSPSVKVEIETGFGIPKRLGEMNMPASLKKLLFVYVCLLKKSPPETAFPFVDRLTDAYFDNVILWTEPTYFQIAIEQLDSQSLSAIAERLLRKQFEDKDANEIAKKKITYERKKSHEDFFKNLSRFASNLPKSKRDDTANLISKIAYQMVTAESALDKDRSGHFALLLIDPLHEYLDKVQSAKIVELVFDVCRNPSTKIPKKVALLKSTSKLVKRASLSTELNLTSHVAMELVDGLSEHKNAIEGGFGTEFNQSYCRELILLLIRSDQLLSEEESNAASRAIQFLDSVELAIEYFNQINQNLETNTRLQLGDVLIDKYFDLNTESSWNFEEKTSFQETQLIAIVARFGDASQIDDLLNIWIDFYGDPSHVVYGNVVYVNTGIGERIYYFIKHGSDENRKLLLRKLLDIPENRSILWEFCQCKMPQPFADWSAKQIVVAFYSDQIVHSHAVACLMELTYVASLDCLASLMKTFKYDWDLNTRILSQISFRSGKGMKFPWEAMKWIASKGVRIEEIPEWRSPRFSPITASQNGKRIADQRVTQRFNGDKNQTASRLFKQSKTWQKHTIE